MRNVLDVLTKYWWVAILVLLVGNVYRYGPELLPSVFGSPAMKPFGQYAVTISPPQYVLVCQQEVYLDEILAASSEVARKNMYASMRVPGVNSLPRCDYLGQNGQFVKVSGALNLTFVREAFVLPADPSLGPYEGAELSGRIYMMMIGSQPHFLLLAHPKIDGVYQDWAIDYLTLAYGQ